MIDWSQVKDAQREYDHEFDQAYASAVQYLKDTDWQVVALYERKREIPEDVKVGRLQALDVVTSA